MKAITLIPLLFLTACTSTKYQDQSKHYSYTNYQSNYQAYQETQKTYPNYPKEEILFKQTDSEYLKSTPPTQNIFPVEDVGQFNCKERTSVRFPKHHHPCFAYPFIGQ
jgi:hypothetical protein